MKIYNTLNKQKETFEPITAGEVKMYVCGVTPYDYAHIGNARPAIVFDTLYRFLQAQGNKVTYVRNFTDVDDKIIQRAGEQNYQNWQDLPQKFIEIYHQDMKALNVLGSADDENIHEPRVTEHIDDIIAMVKTLLDKGIAYIGQSGDVLYDTTKFESYGKLSGNALEDLQAGQRVAISDDKRHATDFVLWKSTKVGEPMSWPFEYEDKDGNKVNAGRPGWHIECSAMAHNKFGNSFDIHGGGEDLKFPHHECEIAQSKGSCGGDHARYWMHNAFINVDGEKMSKSLGNFKTIHSLLEKYSGEAIRLWMLSTHYRKPVDMTEEALDRAEEKLKSWYGTLYRVGQTVDLPRQDGTEISSYMRDSLSDDLNTPLAIAQIEGQMSSLNSDMTNVEGEILSNLMADAQVLGLLQQDPAEYLGIVSDVDAEVQALVEKRKQAKADKDWALADSLKAEIIAKGYELTDKPGGEVELRKVKP